MLYLMIPPVLVVLSLTGIIFFLFKKSRKVAEFSLVEKREVSVSRDSGSFKKSSLSIIGRLGIYAREKFLGGSRDLFLNMGKSLIAWGESLKEKRRNVRDSFAKKEMGSDFDGAEKRQKGRFGFSRKNIGKFSDEIFSAAKEDQVESNFSEKKDIGKEEIFSEPKIEEKSQLEDALIERIAGNPKDMEAYERLGQYYFEIGNYDHAKECYKQVMKLSPGNIGVRSRMRKLERMLGG